MYCLYCPAPLPAPGLRQEVRESGAEASVAPPYHLSLPCRLSEARDTRALSPAGPMTLDFRFMFSRAEIGCIKVRIWYFSLKMGPEGARA